MKFSVEVYKQISLRYEMEADSPAAAIDAAIDLDGEEGPTGLCIGCTGYNRMHPWTVDDGDEWDWSNAAVEQLS